MLNKRRILGLDFEKGIEIGVSFGVTSGVITTLGLLVGLATSTQSKLAVVSGVLTIAIADALSDSLGIHISQESQKAKDVKTLWNSALATFLAKFLTALTFVIPIMILDLSAAVVISGVWGLVLLGVLSYFIAKAQKETPHKVIIEHLVVALVVILISAGLGHAMSNLIL